MTYVVVSGTDTGVGKTIVTAALAVRAVAAGQRVAVLKPGQTGTAAFAPGEEPDTVTVGRLAGPGITTRTLRSYPDPLAPLAAAEVAGLPPLYLDEVLVAAADLARDHDVVLVEGAGGLLVPMGPQTADRPWTIADAAIALRAPVVVVARAGLGTLNHTALTREALAARGLTGHVVIGSWPREPELVHERNLVDFEVPIAGRLPDGAGTLAPADFQVAAPGWFRPDWTPV
jgi:dethiobiotin synthetase